ncbi:hypothetical protein ABE504_23750 [Paenibacillus oryzisoli]|uniref:hypothetical protein n=1 Tax=Paenibacillus oryzisoli TaxID=1850517 RepID=UPI003D28213C
MNIKNIHLVEPNPFEEALSLPPSKLNIAVEVKLDNTDMYFLLLRKGKNKEPVPIALFKPHPKPTAELPFVMKLDLVWKDGGSDGSFLYFQELIQKAIHHPDIRFQLLFV